jgi:hypothetical protein
MERHNAAEHRLGMIDQQAASVQKGALPGELEAPRAIRNF